MLTSQSGGNAGMTVTGTDSLLVISPANRRIDAWRVSLRSKNVMAKDVAAPSGITLAKGVLSWSGSAKRYRVTPILIKVAAGYEDTEVLPHASIDASDEKLDLSRQLLIGATYVFEISALDADGRFSTPARSAELVNR